MIHVFVHIATLGSWKTILDELLSRIKSSGLRDKAAIHFNSCGQPIGEVDGLQVMHHGNLELYELPTLQTLHCLSKEEPDSDFLYIHTKGASTPDNECINDWRKYMSHFVINKHELCLKTLEYSNSCGVDLRESPSLHYSGNFWWAKGKHLASLPNVKDLPVILTERHKAEFWVASKGSGHVSLWDSEIPSHERHLHRYLEEKYAR